MFEIEPLECAVDAKTFSIILHWKELGREVAEKLLYEDDAKWTQSSLLPKSLTL